MATTQNQPWREGDEGWEVEWCKHLPTYPDDPTTIDRDNAEYVTRNFRDKDAAYAYAREVLPQDAFGTVRVTPFVLERLSDEYPFHVRHNSHKEYTADTDYVEAEEQAR